MAKTRTRIEEIVEATNARNDMPTHEYMSGTGFTYLTHAKQGLCKKNGNTYVLHVESRPCAWHRTGGEGIVQATQTSPVSLMPTDEYMSRHWVRIC